MKDTLAVRLFRRNPRLALLLIFVALAVVHTWPLAARPSLYSRLDTGRRAAQYVGDGVGGSHPAQGSTASLRRGDLSSREADARVFLKYTPFEGVPAIYDVLQNSEHVAVLELPISPRTGAFRNATYMVNATRHWKPLVNGYSGFVPPDYFATARTLNRFPGSESFTWLRANGVTTVVAPSRLRPAQGQAPACAD